MIRILAVMADGDRAESIRSMLATDPVDFLHVEEAEDLKAAAALCRRSNFDICLLDCTGNGTPDGTAPELLTRAVANPDMQGPFLTLLDTSDPEVQRAAVEAGAADALPWPELVPPLLQRAIRYGFASRKAEQQLAALALFDADTGLARQPLFWEILSLAVNRARRNSDYLAVLMIYLPGLAEASPVIAADVASRMIGLIRASDTAARFEANQLAVLVEGMPRADGIQTVAEKIIAAIDEPFSVDGKRVPIQASVGISMYPTGAVSPEGLINNATTAMLEALEKGGGTFVFA